MNAQTLSDVERPQQKLPRSHAPQGSHRGKPSGYLPTLDGWRAIAILLVLFYHAKVYVVGPFSTRFISHFGLFGVDIFFGISGLLICTRLLEEEKMTGSLHLKGFYIRRTLRILPAAFLYLGVVALFMHFGTLTSSWPSIAASALFVRNYIGISYSTAHFWSLSVEEHFYLFLPSFLLYVRRYRIATLCTLAAASVICSVLRQHGVLGGSKADTFGTLYWCCFLLLPAALAIGLQNGLVRARAGKYAKPWIVIPLCLAIASIFHPKSPLICLLPAAMLTSTLLHPKNWISRFLELGFLKFIGKISFGLYLWQQVIFNGRFDAGNSPFGIAHSFPYNFLLVGCLATASYYLLERPCMRLGHRLAKPVVPGRPELATATR